MSVVTMRKLLEAGVHYGHQTRKWNPKVKPYIYTSRANVYIIDLDKSMEKIDAAYEAMKKIGENNGKVLFVGTKRQAQQIVLEESLRSGSFYIVQRWLGGTLTNFKTIQKRINRLIEIQQMIDTQSINDYPKKEQAQIRKEGAKLENFLGGIKEMRKLPDAIFVVEPMEEKNAVAEARKLGIPVFGIVDTNCDPDMVDYPIPGNDDAVRSIKLLVGLMADALVEAKGGLLEVAYTQDEQPEVTMHDVIVNVDAVNAENERKRKEKMEERRKQTMNRMNNRFPRKYNRNENAEGEEKSEEVAEATEEPKVEEAAPAEEAPKKRTRAKKAEVEEKPAEEAAPAEEE